MSAPFPPAAVAVATDAVEQGTREYRAAQNAEDDAIMRNLAAKPRLAAVPEDDNATDPVQRLNLIGWADLFAKDFNTEDWLVEPVLARSRGHSVVASPKVGKSLLMMNLAAHGALGRNAFTGEPIEPVRTLYLDYEQTEGDLFERFSDMGFTAEDAAELEGRFHYALIPQIGPLDTDKGAADLFMAMGELGDIDLVVIDTMSRCVEGNENDSSTVQDMYRFVCSHLKRKGIAYVRLDHLGKDTSRDARGSSAKNDDVDIVWKLERNDNGALKLKATHRRIGWCPETLNLAPKADVLGWTTERRGWVPGTQEVAEILDRLGVDVDVTVRAAMAALTANGNGKRQKVVSDAVRFRKVRDPLNLDSENAEP